MMNDPRVVIDCNVAVSAVLCHNSLPRQVVDTACLQGKLLVSTNTIEELEEVLRRPKFNRYITKLERLEFLAALVKSAEHILITEKITHCRDSRDDKYLELAVSGQATHIVSGDLDLRVLHPFRGIAILTPQAFLESMAE
jgi:uncharacterized protein